MRHEKKKIEQFTLTNESKEILKQFTQYYGTTKSKVIDRALLLLAAQYHKSIVIHYEFCDKQKALNKISKEETERLIKIAKTPWIE